MRGRLFLLGVALATASTTPIELFVNCSRGAAIPFANGTGTAADPFSSLVAARNALRMIPRPLTAPAIVQVLAGDCYPRDLTTGAVDFRLPILSLSPLDSGSGPAARITYQASPRGALVRLLGGLPLPARLWQPWTLRIPADAPATGGYDAGSDVTALTLNLTDAGVPAWADLGSFINAGAGSCSSSRAELWYGQRPMMVARWPNARPADSLSTFDHLESVINTTALTVSTTRPLRWVNETAPWLTGYWVYDWADTYVVPVGFQERRAANGTAVGSTILLSAATVPSYGYAAGAKWLGVNLLSELDAPGEYYINAAARTVTFLPPSSAWLANSSVDSVSPPLTPDAPTVPPPVSQGGYVAPVVLPAPTAIDPALEAVISLSDGLIVTAGTSAVAPLHDVSIVGLDVHFSRKTAISLDNAVNVTIADADVSMHGQGCASLTGSALPANITLSNIRCLYVGCKGVYMGEGNAATLQPAAITVADSQLGFHARYARTYNPAIAFGGAGDSVLRNCIFNGPHNGIQGGGRNMLFEGNYLRDLVMEVGDSGAWYAGRSWVSSRGTVIANNTWVRLRNRVGFSLGYANVMATYLDDQLSGLALTDNTYIDCASGLMLGGGRDCLIARNTFFGVDQPILFDNRGMNWQQSSCNVTCIANCNATCPSLGSGMTCNGSGPGYTPAAQQPVYAGQLVSDLVTYNVWMPPYSTAYPGVFTNLTRDLFSPAAWAAGPGKPGAWNASMGHVDGLACVPVNNVFVNNSACAAKPAGLFAAPAANTDATIASWRSVSVGNTNAVNCTATAALPGLPATGAGAWPQVPTTIRTGSLDMMLPHIIPASCYWRRPTPLPSVSPTATASAAASQSASLAPSHTASVQASLSPQATVSPAASMSPAASQSAAASPSGTGTGSSSVLPTPQSAPTSPSLSPAASVTASATGTSGSGGGAAGISGGGGGGAAPSSGAGAGGATAGAAGGNDATSPAASGGSLGSDIAIGVAVSLAALALVLGAGLLALRARRWRGRAIMGPATGAASASTGDGAPLSVVAHQRNMASHSSPVGGAWHWRLNGMLSVAPGSSGGSTNAAAGVAAGVPPPSWGQAVRAHGGPHNVMTNPLLCAAAGIAGTEANGNASTVGLVPISVSGSGALASTQRVTYTPLQSPHNTDRGVLV